MKGKSESDGDNSILGINALSPICDLLLICTVNSLVVIDITFIVVPMHNPEFTSIFLSNITNALSFNSNLCNGNPLTFVEFKNSVRYKLLLRLSVPLSSSTVSTLYRCIIGDSSENFPIAIEFITSQSQFLGVRMAESFSIVPENIFGRITFISVSGVL